MSTAAFVLAKTDTSIQDVFVRDWLDAQAPRENAPPALISHWAAENNADDSVDGNNGTLVGGAGFGLGIVGQAFTGLGDQSSYVRIPHAPNIDLSGSAHTLSNWIFLDSFSTGFTPLTAVKPGAFGGLWGKSDGTLRAHVWDTPTNIRFFDVQHVIPTGEWVHVAQTYDLSTLTLSIYVNGQPIGSGSTGFMAVDYGVINPVLIGKHWKENFIVPAFSASYDEVKIYNYALTSAEVETEFDAGTPAVACAQGSFSATGNEPCQLAPTGSFVDATGATSATLCSAGTYSPNPGATSAGDCLPDIDNDTVLDSNDNCPTVANTLQQDSDADSLGDACDPFPFDADGDADGIDDDVDNCPTVANPADINTGLQPDTDGDFIGDACDNLIDIPNFDQTDTDEDGVGDLFDSFGQVVPGADNCPAVPNPDQADLDNDGLGDACDDDIDGDGFSNDAERDDGSDPLNGDSTPEPPWSRHASIPLK